VDVWDIGDLLLPVHRRTPHFIIAYRNGKPTFDVRNLSPQDLSGIMTIFYSDGLAAYRNVTDDMRLRYDFFDLANPKAQLAIHTMSVDRTIIPIDILVERDVLDTIVIPSTASVRRGQTRQFNAMVTGMSNPAQTVTWSVTGGTASSISPSGLLTVGAGETATNLTVRATSTVNTAISDTANVTVVDNTFSIRASPNPSFGSMPVGYAIPPVEQAVMITNTGTGPVMLIQPTSTNYEKGAI